MQASQAGSAQGWMDRLGDSSLALAMRSELWLYPLVEVVHIIGFSVLVGAVVMFDLRILGLSTGIAVTALARHLLPWAVAALLLIVPAGLMMFSAHPHDFAGNKVFVLKLCLIAAAGINALLFHVGTYRSVEQWNTGHKAPSLARIQALASMMLWTSVILCGRLLAYT
ncbi:hypothetical protein EPZ47_13940 [Pseudomonas viciae]|uniref:DUF6644 domain-containing protein n=1 Tax=Pseudomonas viciae TaxID=2505979 RepID=A0A4P7PGP8_9PSED|nr:DUF6644 family protein [Pseudomonas viciae]QBZ89776.1 hypothetical protein EPZ47_13940 [Pseudomonas viciae]